MPDTTLYLELVVNDRNFGVLYLLVTATTVITFLNHS